MNKSLPLRCVPFENGDARLHRRPTEVRISEVETLSIRTRFFSTRFFSTRSTLHSLQKRSRVGVTLLEILLVMAVMVLMAAIAVPILNGTFEGSKLRRAADVVRSDWGRARVQAIRSGTEWAFVYEPGTGRYAIAPYSPYQPPTIGNSISAEEQGNFDYGEGMLPIGVRFDQGQATADTRSIALDAGGSGGGGADGAGGGSGVQTVLFYPDGTSQQMQLRLVNDRDWYVQIELRALTGTASVSDVAALEDAGGSR